MKQSLLLSIFLILTLLIGCGIEEKRLDQFTKKNTDDSDTKDYSDLGEYVESYLKLAHEIGAKIDDSKIQKITYADLNNLNLTNELHTLGTCFYNYPYNDIKIAKEFENKKTTALKWVLYHEFGHCFFNAEHNLNDYNSIMAVYIPFYISYVTNNSDDNKLVDEAAKTFLKSYLESKN